MSGNNAKGRTVYLHAGRTVVSTPGMHELAASVANILNERYYNDVSHVKIKNHEFANDEGKPEILETVRGEHVFLMCPLQLPKPDTAIVRMGLALDALQRASVDGITLVIPYYPYARQDRKAKPREPISAKWLAKVIERCPAVQRVITFDLHAPQIQGFFEIPVDDLHGLPLHAEFLRERFKGNFSKVTVVAPDVGSTKRAKKLAKLLGPNVPFAVIDKDRQINGEVESLAIVGRVRGRHCVLCDDMIDGGGTIRNAVKSLKKRGALSTITVVTHGIFSKNAAEKFREAKMQVVATQTIPRPRRFIEQNKSWLSFAPIEEYLAKIMHEASLVGGSVSKLYAD